MKNIIHVKASIYWEMPKMEWIVILMSYISFFDWNFA